MSRAASVASLRWSAGRRVVGAFAPLSWVLHHGESIDPTLAEWIRNEIDDLLGLEPATIVVVLGVVIVVLPIGLAVAVVRRRRGPVE